MRLIVSESKTLNQLIIETQQGLGDCIFHRPFIKELIKTYQVYLKTPFTEIYQDLDIKFIKDSSRLRTQDKNIKRSKVEFVKAPNAQIINPKYSSAHLATGNIVDGLKKGYGIAPKEYDLPNFERITRDKPICVVRPASIRNEWLSLARNPLAEYIYEASKQAMADYHVISVADIDGVNEMALEPMPMAHEYYNKGELNTAELIGLIQSADLVIGGVGFIVPMCISAKIDLYCILGGNGGYNHPNKITHETMDLSKVTFCYPDNYCMCTKMTHKCDKHITNFSHKFKAYLDARKTAIN